MSTNVVSGDIVSMDNGDLGVVTSAGTISPLTISNGGMVGLTSATISNIVETYDNTEDIMEKWIMNRITIDHKVQEQELMKLKEVAPDYANEIKENLAKNAARDMIKKITFTKKHDKDADVHHFIGRVWCFTEQELKEFIKEARNV